jgi:hypothetical protein
MLMLRILAVVFAEIAVRCIDARALAMLGVFSAINATLRPLGAGGLMLLLGWSSDAMPRHYGRSAAAERARELETQLGIGENV